MKMMFLCYFSIRFKCYCYYCLSLPFRSGPHNGATANEATKEIFIFTSVFASHSRTTKPFNGLLTVFSHSYIVLRKKTTKISEGGGNRNSGRAHSQWICVFGFFLRRFFDSFSRKAIEMETNGHIIRAIVRCRAIEIGFDGCTMTNRRPGPESIRYSERMFRPISGSQSIFWWN